MEETIFFNAKILIKNELFGCDVQRKNLISNNHIMYFFITFILIIFLQLYPSNSWGYQKKFGKIKYSSNFKNMTIEKVCGEIYKQTSYKILFGGLIPKKKITVEFRNNSLSEIIATIINRADVTNYTMIRDDINNTIRINIYDSGGALASAPEKRSVEKKDITANEVEPGFSYNDMENVIKKYNRQKQNLVLTDEIEPGFTYKNMEDVMKKYHEQKQGMVSTDEVEPGLTYKDMDDAIKKHHKKTNLIRLHK